MKSQTINGYIYTNLCSKVGHKRYQNIVEDEDEGKMYTYETDHPSFHDGLRDIEEDSESNSYTGESVELTYKGDEPTDADYERFNAARDKMHREAETAMILAIKAHGDVEEL